MSCETTLIALGANLSGPCGGPAEMLCAALREMVAQGMRLGAVSRFFRTPAFPTGSGPDYINACAALEGEEDAPGLLARLHAIEAQLGRRRDGTRWGPRGIDLDMLACGGQVLPSHDIFRQWQTLAPDQRGQQAPQELILPHPRLHERGFVLIPLCDVAPGWRHPVLGRTVTEMAQALPGAEIAAITPI